MDAVGSQPLQDLQASHNPAIEVYVTSRTVGKSGGAVFNRMPVGLKQLATDMGFAHYMLVLEDRSAGTLTQFDFGPHGADTHISLPSFRRRKPRSVPGAVREAQLASLPEHRLYVGRTALTLQDIRNFNSFQHLPYSLNVNDCRHYINRTVTYLTGQGEPRVCRALLRHKVLHRQAQQGRSRLRWQDRLILWAHECTDLSHWPTVHRVSQVGSALLGTFVGRKIWSKAVSRSVTRRMIQPATVARVAPAAMSRPSLPSMAVHRAAHALTTAAQAPAARPTRVGPLIRQAARLGARAGTSLRSAAESAATFPGFLRRRAGGPATGLAAAAAGAFKQTSSRRVPAGPPVAV